MNRRLIRIKTGKYRINVQVNSECSYIQSNLCKPSSPPDDQPSSSYPDIDYNEEFNNVMEAFEALILAHARAGVKIDSASYIKGLRIAIKACERDSR